MALSVSGAQVSAYGLVLDLKDDRMGFPSQIEDDPLLELVLAPTAGSAFPHARGTPPLLRGRHQGAARRLPDHRPGPPIVFRSGTGPGNTRVFVGLARWSRTRRLAVRAAPVPLSNRPPARPSAARTTRSAAIRRPGAGNVTMAMSSSAATPRGARTESAPRLRESAPDAKSASSCCERDDSVAFGGVASTGASLRAPTQKNRHDAEEERRHPWRREQRPSGRRKGGQGGTAVPLCASRSPNGNLNDSRHQISRRGTQRPPPLWGTKSPLLGPNEPRDRSFIFNRLFRVSSRIIVPCFRPVAGLLPVAFVSLR